MALLCARSIGASGGYHPATTSSRHAVLQRLATRRLPLEELGTLLASADAVLAHAAAMHLAVRYREGQDEPAQLAATVPEDRYALSAQTQVLFATLALEGLPLQIRDVPERLPPLVRLAWLRAALVLCPALFAEYEGDALGREAASDLPVRRVIAAGLLERLAASRSPALQLLAVDYASLGLERGLLPPPRGQDVLHTIALGRNPAAATSALRALALPWATGLPCPDLRAACAAEPQVAVEAVRVLRARGATEPLRRALAMPGLGAHV
jgi:hypothetical protein